MPTPDHTSPLTRELRERIDRLPPEQQAAAHALLAARSRAHRPRPGIADGRATPVGFGQERLWFAQEVSPYRGFFSCPVAVRLRGELDVPALAAAVAAIAHRHDALRRRYVVVGGWPCFAPTLDPAPELVVTELPDADETDWRAAVAVEAQRPFDLTVDPPFRARLLRISPVDHILVMVAHHMILDDRSEAVLLGELGDLYRMHASGSAATPPRLPVQLADVMMWQRERMTGSFRDDLLTRWRDRLVGSSPTLDLPFTRSLTSVPATSALCTTVLPAGIADRLSDLGRAEGVSIAAVLLAVLRVVLARRTGQRDVLLGLVASDRNVDSDDLVGYFLNLLPIRNPLSWSADLRRLFRDESAAMMSAYADRELPFQLLVDALRPGHGRGAAPLFQVLYNHVYRVDGAWDFGAVTAEPVVLPGTASHLPLSLTSISTGSGITLRWVYDPTMLDAGWITELAEGFGVAAEAAAVRPASTVGELPVIGATDLEFQRKHEWGGPAIGTPGPLAAIRMTARRDPARIAVRAGEEVRTYGDLVAGVDRLAARLRSLRLPEESVVGVLVSRDADLPGTLLGVLAAGHAYLPMDPAQPATRTRALLAESGAKALLTDSPPGVTDLPPGVAHVRREAEGPLVAGCPVEPHPDQLAYVLYTSGSTGSPKGVAVTYGSLTRLLAAVRDSLPSGAADRILALTTVAFDISAVELLLPLCRDGEVVVANLAEPKDGNAVVDEIVRHRPTLVQATPAGWRLIALTDWPGSPDLFAISGGEQLLPVLADDLRRRTRGMWNGYGPTETTIYTTGHVVDGSQEGAVVPIGRPLPAITCHVVDTDLRRVPRGAVGELYVGGDQLARGYLGQPGQTAGRFVPSPFGVPGTRLYRTGDLVRVLPGGALEFTGRSDRQLKVRGFRIEPAEVEGALLRHAWVREAVVTARQDRMGDTLLVAFVVPRPAVDGDPAALRADLARELPTHLVPSLVVVVDGLARGPSGKYDLSSLPDVTDSLTPVGGVPVAGATQTAVAEAWQEMLGVYPSAGQNFFESGGHSLSMMRLSLRLSAVFGVPVPVADLFLRPTVADQAALVDEITVAAVEGLADEELRDIVSGSA